MDTRKRILVVDDDEAVRGVLRSLLESDQREILEAASGSVALAMAAEQMPDLIIMDVGMPNMSGFEATSAIRANPAIKDIPILMCTANAMMGDFERGLAAGANDYITKPFDAQRLKAKVDKMLDSPKIT